MPEFLAVGSGLIIAAMILMNGELSAAYGNYHSTIFIHVTGLIAIAALLLLKKQSLKQRNKVPWHLFLGGVIGVFTVVICNVAYTALGVSLILALGLLGQTVTALLVDGFGWFGAQRKPFEKRKLIGVALIALGAAAMLLL